LNFITSQIIQAAITVHKALGPGLLESVYQKCMVIELERMGIKVESEVELPIFYRDQKVTDLGFRMDLLVESSIIVELKSVEAIMPVHKKQLLTYLKLADKLLHLLGLFVTKSQGFRPSVYQDNSSLLKGLSFLMVS